MWSPSLKRSGRRAAAASVMALAGTLSGCLYSFTGGGLPSHINRIAVLPFELEVPATASNASPPPLLTTDLQQEFQRELPRSLGVRLAAESAADAVVRGRITAYEEVAASVRPTQQEDEVPVVQRQVRISYEAEIYDVREDKPLWRTSSQSVIGNYLPESEAPERGVRRALEDLVKKVIEGAQSQW